MMRRAHKPPSLATLYNLSSQATHEAVHLLCQMLVFDPVSLSASNARVASSDRRTFADHPSLQLFDARVSSFASSDFSVLLLSGKRIAGIKGSAVFGRSFALLCLNASSLFDDEWNIPHSSDPVCYYFYRAG
jgi:hypothetical protein